MPPHAANEDAAPQSPLIRRLVAPRQHRQTRTYSLRPGLWLFRVIAAPALILGVACVAEAIDPTPQTPSGAGIGLLLIAAMALTLGLSILIWCAKVGVHVTPDGIRSVTFSTKPTFTPWAQIDHFDYTRDGNLYRVFLVATDGTRTPMRMLTFWRYQRTLAQAYCDALNTEHTRHNDHAQPGHQPA
jgi:hypothetical protein